LRPLEHEIPTQVAENDDGRHVDSSSPVAGGRLIENLLRCYGPTATSPAQAKPKFKLGPRLRGDDV
jgi:hypothetical protein